MPTNEVKRLQRIIDELQLEKQKMRNTIADKDEEIIHLQYGNEQLRKSLYDLGVTNA